MDLRKFALTRSIELQFFDGATETTWVLPSFDLSALRPSRLLSPGWVWPVCLANLPRKLVTGARWLSHSIVMVIATRSLPWRRNAVSLSIYYGRADSDGRPHSR
jgi:hypothetical protein